MLRISVVGWSMSCRGGSCRPKRCLMTLDVVERTGHSLNGWSAVSVLTENIFCFLFCGRKVILLVILLFLHDNLDMTKIYPRESAEIEYKRSVTDSFLKTVSAFSNTGDGVILFGIDDKTRESCGLPDPEETYRQIKNKINDSIHPEPVYSLSINDEDHTVKLEVREGESKPYYYGQTAYIRKGSSSVPMSSLLLERLILKRDRRSFDDLPAPEGSYSFSGFEEEARNWFGLEQLGTDAQKSLGLRDLNGQVTVAGALLADKNTFPGMDLVVLDNDDLYGEREKVDGISILQQLESAVAFFRRYYRREAVTGNLQREEIFLIPESAFREAVSNALVHRTWDTPSNIVIRMFPDRIEIQSPGGLPDGISEYEYLHKDLSVPRNVTLATLFLRLGLIEKLGTGVRRILRSYQGQYRQPDFDFTPNSMTVILPVLNQKPSLSLSEVEVIRQFQDIETLSRAELSTSTGFSRSKLGLILKKLVENKVLAVEGGGRSTRYRLNPNAENLK